MNESWKEIEGHEGYWVSNTGLVRGPEGMFRLDAKNKRVLVSIKTNGKWYRLDVSRLVARAFIANPRKLDTIVHKDGDYYNNDADNLEWCSRSEHPSFVVKRKKVYIKTKGASPRQALRKPVFQVSVEGIILERFESIRHASLKTGIRENAISKCCKGELKSTGGFRWAYANLD